VPDANYTFDASRSFVLRTVGAGAARRVGAQQSAL
jgi:hypothetical protein